MTWGAWQGEHTPPTPGPLTIFLQAGEMNDFPNRHLRLAFPDCVGEEENV